jgi:hypothetical protein
MSEAHNMPINRDFLGKAPQTLSINITGGQKNVKKKAKQQQFYF